MKGEVGRRGIAEERESIRPMPVATSRWYRGAVARVLMSMVPLIAVVAPETLAQQPSVPADTSGRALVGPLPAARAADSVEFRLVDVELSAAVQALGRYLDRPILFNAPSSERVTLETPRPIARTEVLRLLRGLVESRGLELLDDSTGGLYQVRGSATPDGAGQVQGPGVGVPQAGGTDAVQLFVIRLRHARAVDVAAMVNALYGRAAALGELGGRATGMTPALTQQLGRNVVLPQSQTGSDGVAVMSGYDASGRSGAGTMPVLASGTAHPAELTGELTIVPDPNGNALLVRASSYDYELVAAAVEQLDVRPLQVLIEVVIAEVRRDRSFSFGVELGTPERDVPHLDGVRASVSQKGVGLGDFALHVMRNAPGVDFEATLRASAARGDARILSRPILLASNGEEAEILVGSQRPFVQVQRSLPTDTPIRDQVVQYKDVGTRLTVKPTISSDGYVSLSVTQEVNAATAETQFDAPVISTRTVQTTLLVRDSQTVVLGGLADRQREATQGGIPVLSAIPLVGGFFGRTNRLNTETEFFLFLRPRIIRTDAEAEAATDPYKRRADHMPP